MAARIVAHWPPPDTWPERLRGWLVCSWRGHRFTVPKMTGRLCARCRTYRAWPP